jgi:acetyl esterase
MQKTAPLSVKYGRGLDFSGTDLPGPGRIRVPTRHGNVRCLVFRPEGAVGTYVHLHGGALVMRYPKMDDFFCRLVAAEVGTTVVSVDYDVAPQVRYPVAQEQAHDVLSWVSTGWGGPVAVGGFSAGGNLAASAALQARDLGSCSPVLQLLGVPALDVAEAGADKACKISNPMITPALLELVSRSYFKDASRRAEPYASPLLAPTLVGVAPAMVITAEYDRLRAEGDAYAVRLQAAGVPTEHLLVPSMDHYFLGSRPQARGVLDQMAAALRSALHGPV